MTRIRCCCKAEAQLEAEIAAIHANAKALMTEAEQADAEEDERDGRDPFKPKPRVQRNFTAPESKIMKASDSVTQVIVCAELSNEAPDARQLAPALDQLAENLDAIDAELPDGAAMTADAGYFSEDSIRITQKQARPRSAHRDRPLQAHRTAATRAAGAGSPGRDPEAADGARGPLHIV